MRTILVLSLAWALCAVPSVAAGSGRRSVPEAAAVVRAVLVMYPRAPAEALPANVAAARAAGTAQVPATLLLALARTESSYDPTSVSRLIDGARQTGPWRSTRRPPGARGNFYCGVTQAKGATWARCLALRDLDTAYRTTVVELEYWLGRCARRARAWECALAGYGAGNAGAARGTSSYARRVLVRARGLGAQI